MVGMVLGVDPNGAGRKWIGLTGNIHIWYSPRLTITIQDEEWKKSLRKDIQKEEEIENSSGMMEVREKLLSVSINYKWIYNVKEIFGFGNSGFLCRRLIIMCMEWCWKNCLFASYGKIFRLYRCSIIKCSINVSKYLEGRRKSIVYEDFIVILKIGKIISVNCGTVMD